ncbi:MAG TPA: VCBS repeat-containing protein [Bryobacteraceae bacterium]
MTTVSKCTATLIAVLFLLVASAHAQDSAHATAKRTQPGHDPDGKPRIAFLTLRLGADHAEGISMIDMNGDGFVDLLSGAYWYGNPGRQGGEWKQHQFRTVGIHNEFVSDCGEWVIDVDHDGLPDLVTSGWISNGVWWFRNPGPQATVLGEQWKGEKITDSFDTEGGAFADITGDGRPDLALAHYNRAGVIWIDFADNRPKVHHLGDSQQDGHGIGIADINGDGKADILTTHGWFQQIDADADKWQWHPDWTLGETGFPILAYDVNHDGKMDLIYGQGHGYGLYWLEHAGTHERPQWIRHTIDDSFSQSHALALVDLNGDGRLQLVTGKRYRAHSGGDPGAYDPTVVYAYRLPGATELTAAKTHTGTNAADPTMTISDPAADPVFNRIALSVNGTATIGTQIVTADFDQDGDLDLATAGKLGVHVFENLKVNQIKKAAREDMQPINRAWPFPGEGAEVPQEDGPAVPK